MSPKLLAALMKLSSELVTVYFSPFLRILCFKKITVYFFQPLLNRLTKASDNTTSCTYHAKFQDGDANNIDSINDVLLIVLHIIKHLALCNN